MEQVEPIKLGAKVKDSITGFSGTLMARTVYLYGCIWLLIESKDLHDGKPVECWFDEPRVVLVKARRKLTAKEKEARGLRRLHRTFGPARSGPTRSVPTPRTSD